MASLTTIKQDDIIEADVKGRRFIAHVQAKQHGKLQVRPLDRGVTFRTVTARQVKRHWRLTKNTG